MSDDQHAKKHDSDLAQKIGSKSSRKLRARHSAHRETWFGLGMMGLVGWSIAIPTLGGLMLGIWIDRTYPTGFSWTLMLLVTGLLIGCLNIWYWLGKQSKELRDDEEQDNVEDNPDQDKPESGQTSGGKKHE